MARHLLHYLDPVADSGRNVHAGVIRIRSAPVSDDAASR